MWRVGAQVRDSSKTNIRQQKTPHGNKWKARAKKRKGKGNKLLAGLIPLIVVSDKMTNDKRAVVTLKPWSGTMKSRSQKKQHAALIGNVHQKGKSMTFGGHQPPQGKDITRKQAKMLRDMGFTVWARRLDPNAKQGKRRKPPIKWIVDNVSVKEFRRWLGKARDEGQMKQPKSSGNLPARRFLGVSRQRYRKIWARALQGINYGWKVKAQNMKRGR